MFFVKFEKYFRIAIMQTQEKAPSTSLISDWISILFPFIQPDAVFMCADFFVYCCLQEKMWSQFLIPPSKFWSEFSDVAKKFRGLKPG